jgi:anti-sigma B factor antagonist
MRESSDDRIDVAGGAASFQVSVRDPREPTVTITGELDIASVDGVAEGIEPYLADPTERVVFDLGNLEFMDSSGIALLVRVANRVGTVQVSEASPIVRRVLEATGLVGTFGMDG